MAETAQPRSRSPWEGPFNWLEMLEVSLIQLLVIYFWPSAEPRIGGCTTWWAMCGNGPATGSARCISWPKKTKRLASWTPKVPALRTWSSWSLGNKMAESLTAGFLSHGGTPSYHPFDGIFPKPSSYCGTPIYENPNWIKLVDLLI